MLRLLRFSRPDGEPNQLASDLPAKRQRPQDPLRDLAQRAADGNLQAAQTLLVAVGPAVLRTVRGVLGAHHPDVPDVCQEAALALLSALPRFRAECTALHFACRVAVLTAVNARRRAMTRAALQPDLDLDALGSDTDAVSPEKLAEQARRRDAVRHLLDDLPMPQAEALALHVVLGYTVEETAATVGAPPNTVRSRLRRALGALRDRIQEDTGLFQVIEGGV